MNNDGIFTSAQKPSFCNKITYFVHNWILDLLNIPFNDKDKTDSIRESYKAQNERESNSEREIESERVHGEIDKERERQREIVCERET